MQIDTTNICTVKFESLPIGSKFRYNNNGYTNNYMKTNSIIGIKEKLYNSVNLDSGIVTYMSQNALVRQIDNNIQRQTVCDFTDLKVGDLFFIRNGTNIINLKIDKNSYICLNNNRTYNLQFDENDSYIFTKVYGTLKVTEEET